MSPSRKRDLSIQYLRGGAIPQMYFPMKKEERVMLAHPQFLGSQFMGKIELSAREKWTVCSGLPNDLQ